MSFYFLKPKKLPRELIWGMFMCEEECDSNEHIEFDAPLKRYFIHPLKVLNM
jgi:hypothetical protein